MTERPDFATEILARLRDVADFPRAGVHFKDITPLLLDPGAYERTVAALVGALRPLRPDLILGVEARGFLFAAPVALNLGLGFVPARKPGKLPAERLSVPYTLEYGESALEMHRDAIRPGQRVAVVDDVLATGGTSRAAATLVGRAGGEVAAFAYVAELAFLKGRKALPAAPVVTLATVR